MFGILKRFPNKLQFLLIRVKTLDKPLIAKCFIHVVGVSLFIPYRILKTNDKYLSHKFPLVYEMC